MCRVVPLILPSCNQLASEGYHTKLINNKHVAAYRCALQVLPKPAVLMSAILKAAVGSPVLAGSLSPDAFLQEVHTALRYF